MTNKPDTNTVTVDPTIEASTIVDQSTNVDEIVEDDLSLETRKLRKRSNSHVSGVSGTSEKSVKQIQCATASVDDVPDVEKTKTPFDELIKAAAILNPRQFELPRNMSIFVQFPGGDKSK